MTRPIWQRALFGEVLWKDMTTAMKVANVVASGGVFALMMLYAIPLIFVIAGGALFAFRYRKLQKAEQS
jgi:hypothetical protein